MFTRADLIKPQADHHRNGDWFLTASGKQFWPMDPEAADVRIEDIAHALANICRFGGHCRQFYSVAQHSVLVAAALPAALQLQGLLHDGTEAYVGDMIRPFKRAMPAYREAERAVWLAIAAEFGLPEELDPNVKHADDVLLMTERRDLMPESEHAWGLEGKVKPLEIQILPWTPDEAKRNFLAMFDSLIEQPRREA